MLEKRRSAGAKETVLGICLLMLLVGIGAGVFFEQYRFYPALIEPGSFSTVPAVSETETVSILSDTRWPDRLTPLSAGETFDADTLSDKIDGKAPLYLSAGFRHLETRRFFLGEPSDAWMEAFVYRMKDPQSAFSVFSMQKRDGALPVELGQAAYRTPNALYFVSGPYYVELVAASETPLTQNALRALGKALSARLPSSTEKEGNDRLFPEQGLNAESILRIAADAFGFEKLDNVYTASYRMDGVDLTAFVSRRTDSEAARDLASAYQTFLLEFDAEISETGIPAKENIVAYSIMGWTEVLFSQGPYFAGVHQATDRKKALELAEYLNRHLSKLDGNN